MKKSNALKTSVMASLLGVLSITMMSQVSQAGCQIYDSTNVTGQPGLMIGYDTNPVTYPSIRGFYYTLQHNPDLFELVGKDKPNQTIYMNSFEPVDGVQKLVYHEIKYIPPDVKTGDHYTVDAISDQYKKRLYPGSAGVEGPAYITANTDDEADLQKFMNAIPACKTSPGSPATGQAPAPVTATGTGTPVAPRGAAR